MSVVWITGAGSGIGRALAVALANGDTRIALSGRRPELLIETANLIKARASDCQVLPYSCDVSDHASVDSAAAEIESRWGAIDTLINNAGSNTYRGFATATLHEFEDLFRINCLGAVHTLQRVLPDMRRRRAGTIVNVSSILGKVPSSDSAAYTVSKFAVTGLNESLHQALAGTGVRIMGVYPGYIQTPMTAAFVEPNSLKWRLGKTADQMAAAIVKGLRRGKRDVYFPWYVPWAIRLHFFFPGWIDLLARAVRARGEKSG